MAKPKGKVRVSFPGNASHEVTGSMTLVETDGMKILIEAGLVQGGSTLQDWRTNSRHFPFRPNTIDYIFIGHGHADHMLLIPKLYKEHCTAKIIAPRGTKALFDIMAHDSAYIISKDAQQLQQAFGKYFDPFYTADDVDTAMEYFEEYDFDEMVELPGGLRFKFIPSGHIINAAQIMLWVPAQQHYVKIGYTSDLGSTLFRRYINHFEPIDNCALLIGECTYARETRPVTPRDRRNDMLKIKSIIETTCVENHSRVLIPVFSLDRAQNIASFIYDLFNEDESFDIPVLVDSPLTVKLFRYMLEHANPEDAAYLEKVMAWKNLVLIEESEQSRQWMESSKPCVILSSAGMLTAGRSRRWAASLLPQANAHILFCGFATESSLAGQIRHGSDRKYISIEGKLRRNRCSITELRSFSGHMGRNDLINYYADVDTPRIALVHGDANAKIQFAADLEAEMQKRNRTGRAICVNKGTQILL